MNITELDIKEYEEKGYSFHEKDGKIIVSVKTDSIDDRQMIVGIIDKDSKIEDLDFLMENYADNVPNFQYDEANYNILGNFVSEVESSTGKKVDSVVFNHDEYILVVDGKEVKIPYNSESKSVNVEDVKKIVGVDSSEVSSTSNQLHSDDYVTDENIDELVDYLGEQFGEDYKVTYEKTEDGKIKIKVNGQELIEIDDTYKVEDVLTEISNKANESNDTNQNNPSNQKSAPVRSKIYVNLTLANQMMESYKKVLPDLLEYSNYMDTSYIKDDKLRSYYNSLKDNTPLLFYSLADYITGINESIDFCVQLYLSKDEKDYNELETICESIWGGLIERHNQMNDVANNSSKYGNLGVGEMLTSDMTNISSDDYIGIMSDVDGYFEPYYGYAKEDFQTKLRMDYQKLLREKVPQVYDMMIELCYINKDNPTMSLEEYKNAFATNILDGYNINPDSEAPNNIPSDLWTKEGITNYDKALLVLSYDDSLINPIDPLEKYPKLDDDIVTNTLRELFDFEKTTYIDDDILYQCVNRSRYFLGEVKYLYTNDYSNMTVDDIKNYIIKVDYTLREHSRIDMDIRINQPSAMFDTTWLARALPEDSYKRCSYSHWAELLPEEAIVTWMNKDLDIERSNEGDYYVISDVTDPQYIYQSNDEILQDFVGSKDRFITSFEEYNGYSWPVDLYGGPRNDTDCYNMEVYNQTFAVPQFHKWYIDNYGLHNYYSLMKEYYTRSYNDPELGYELDNPYGKEDNWVDMKLKGIFGTHYRSGRPGATIEQVNSFKIIDTCVDTSLYEPFSSTFESFCRDKITIDNSKKNIKLAALQAIDTTDIKDGEWEDRTDIYGDWKYLEDWQKKALVKLYKDKGSVNQYAIETLNDSVNAKKGEKAAMGQMSAMLGTDIDNDFLQEVYTYTIGVPIVSTTIGGWDGLCGSIAGVVNFAFADGKLTADDYRKMYLQEFLSMDNTIFVNYKNNDPTTLAYLGTNEAAYRMILVDDSGEPILSNKEMEEYSSCGAKVYQIAFSKGLIDEKTYSLYSTLDYRKNDTDYMNLITNSRNFDAGAAKFTYNLSSGIGNMVIPMALSAAFGPEAMMAWTFLSVSGNERERLLRMGHKNDGKTFLQAGCKGLLAVAAERILGGLTGIGQNAGKPISWLEGLMGHGKAGDFIAMMLSSQLREITEELTENFLGYGIDYIFDGTVPNFDDVLHETWETTYMTFCTTPFINFMGEGFRGNNYFHDIANYNTLSTHDLNGIKADFSTAEVMRFTDSEGNIDYDAFFKFLSSENRFANNQLNMRVVSLNNNYDFARNGDATIIDASEDGTTFKIRTKYGEEFEVTKAVLESQNIEYEIQSMNSEYEHTLVADAVHYMGDYDMLLEACDEVGIQPGEYLELAKTREHMLSDEQLTQKMRVDKILRSKYMNADNMTVKYGTRIGKVISADTFNGDYYQEGSTIRFFGCVGLADSSIPYLNGVTDTGDVAADMYSLYGLNYRGEPFSTVGDNGTTYDMYYVIGDLSEINNPIYARYSGTSETGIDQSLYDANVDSEAARLGRLAEETGVGKTDNVQTMKGANNNYDGQPDLGQGTTENLNGLGAHEFFSPSGATINNGYVLHISSEGGIKIAGVIGADGRLHRLSGEIAIDNYQQLQEINPSYIVENEGKAKVATTMEELVGVPEGTPREQSTSRSLYIESVLSRGDISDAVAMLANLDEESFVEFFETLDTRESSKEIEFLKTFRDTYLNGQEVAADPNRYHAFFQNFREHGNNHAINVAQYAYTVAYGNDVNMTETMYASMEHDYGMKGGYLYVDAKAAAKIQAAGMDVKVGDVIEIESLRGLQFTDGDIQLDNFVRGNHPLNSAVAILTENNGMPADVDTSLVALLAMTHSKSTSGIKVFDSQVQWNEAITKLDATIDQYNKDHGTDYQFDAERLRSVVNGTDAESQAEFARWQREALAIRDGDAFSPIVTRGENGILMQDGSVVQVSYGENRSYDSPVLSIEEETALITDVKLLDDGSTTPISNEFSKRIHAGENNLDFGNNTYYQNDTYAAQLEVIDPNFAPHSTFAAIQERIGEVETYNNTESRSFEIILPKEAQGTTIGLWYEEQLARYKTKYDSDFNKNMIDHPEVYTEEVLRKKNEFHANLRIVYK